MLKKIKYLESESLSVVLEYIYRLYRIKWFHNSSVLNNVPLPKAFNG